jgi:NhaP-type Na+/H+ or K+/H+ antiporter
VSTRLTREPLDQRAVKQAPKHGNDQNEPDAQKRQVQARRVPLSAELRVACGQPGDSEDQLAESRGTQARLAVFIAGITFSRRDQGHELGPRLHHGAEPTGRLLEMAIILMIGASLTTAGLIAPGLSGWLLAPLLILIIRPALVYLVTGRGPMTRHERRFLSFFGVRGVAAVYYATIVTASHQLPAAQTQRIVWTTLACVAISIVLHGVSATPATQRLLR